MSGLKKNFNKIGKENGEHWYRTDSAYDSGQ